MPVIEQVHKNIIFEKMAMTRKTMTKEEARELRTKIEQGINLAHKRLVIAKQKDDGELVYSKNGKIVKIKARDLKK